MNKSLFKSQILFYFKVFSVFALFINILPINCKSQTVVKLRSVTSSCGTSKSITTEGNQYIIQQSIGQNGITGTTKNNNYILRQGFIQPPITIGKSNEEKTLLAKSYPNPFNTDIKISFNEEIKSNLIVILYNLQGTSVYYNVFPSTQDLEIHFPPMLNGVYFLKIQSNNKYYTTKLIKE